MKLIRPLIAVLLTLLTVTQLSYAAYQPGAAAGTASAPSADLISVQQNCSNCWQYTTASGGLVSTTAVQVVAAPGASLKNYVTFFSCQNEHATVSTEIELQDGNGGTRFGGGYAQAVGGGFVYGNGMGIVYKQPTANTALYIKELTGTPSTGVMCTVKGYYGP